MAQAVGSSQWQIKVMLKILPLSNIVICSVVQTRQMHILDIHIGLSLLLWSVVVRSCGRLKDAAPVVCWHARATIPAASDPYAPLLPETADRG